MASSFSLNLTTREALTRLWLEWIARHKKTIAIIFMMMVITSAASSAYPAMISYVFDAFGDASAGLVWQIPPLIIIIAGVKSIALYLQIRYMNKLALTVTTAIQKAMAAHLIRADLALVLAAPAGEFVSRLMNDLLLVREAIIRIANSLVRDVLMVIFMVGMMIWFDWVLTLVVLAVYPLALKPVLSIGQRQRRQSSRLQENMAEMTALLSESVQASRMTRAYGLEDHETRRVSSAFDNIFNSFFQLILGRARIEPIMEILGGIAIAGVVSFAGWRALNGHIQAGDVAGFITALVMLVRPVRSIGTLNVVVQESVAALNRVFALFDAKPEIKDAESPLALDDFSGTIEFQEVSFDYGVGKVVDGVSFTAKRGSVVALVGASGSGKTTVLNLIPRLFDCASGRITFDGVDIKSLRLADLRGMMALVSQDAVLFNDTISSNIRLGRFDASDDEIIDAARMAAAHDFIQEQPQGYETMVGEGGGRLSGGQRQRIAIARAILRDAPILLLDEATSALDAESEQHIRTALEQFAPSRTTIVVAHRLATVQGADEILVMDEGRIVERGKHASLIKKNGIYARLCALQHFAE